MVFDWVGLGLGILRCLLRHGMAWHGMDRTDGLMDVEKWFHLMRVLVSGRRLKFRFCVFLFSSHRVMKGVWYYCCYCCCCCCLRAGKGCWWCFLGGFLDFYLLHVRTIVWVDSGWIADGMA